jgi:hypothetical protein
VARNLKCPSKKQAKTLKKLILIAGGQRENACHWAVSGFDL